MFSPINSSRPTFCRLVLYHVWSTFIAPCRPWLNLLPPGKRDAADPPVFAASLQDIGAFVLGLHHYREGVFIAAFSVDRSLYFGVR